jgi:tripartite-type tricarboxylate transporter receptor subunit TctC
MLSWTCHIGPNGLPAEVMKKLHSLFKKLAATPEWRDWCAAKGSIPSPELVGEEAAKFIDQDAELQRPILEELGIVKR